MSDKKEIVAMSIKISVDSSDLDKLEAQLKRIEGLMVSTGLKQPTSVGFSADKFFVANGQVFIDEALIASRVISSGDVFLDSTAFNTSMREAAAKGAKEGAEKAGFTLRASAAIARLDETITHKESEFEKLKRMVENKFSQLQSSITAIQHTQASFDKANAIAIEQIRTDIKSAKSGWL